MEGKTCQEQEPSIGIGKAKSSQHHRQYAEAAEWFRRGLELDLNHAALQFYFGFATMLAKAYRRITLRPYSGGTRPPNRVTRMLKSISARAM